MKRSIILMVALLLTVAQGAWAQTVSNASELISAVGTYNASIVLDADIQLNSYLNIDGVTVTIDLNGHKLYRDISGSHASDGHVIYVHNNATLTLANSKGTGSIEGGKANNGGAIFIEPGSTVSASNVTFQNNSAAKHGGAIWNGGVLTASNCTFSDNKADDVGGIYNAAVDNSHYGAATLTNCTLSGNIGQNGCGALGNAAGGTSLTLNNCTVTGNTAGTNGGGIWNAGTLTVTGGSITGNTCASDKNGGGIFHLMGSLNMSGNPVVTGNTKGGSANNIYLAASKVINVAGTFTEGTAVGVTLETIYGTFTSGLTNQQSAIGYFSSDYDDLVVKVSGGEGYIELPGQGVAYIERSWNGSQVVSTVKTRTGTTALSSNTGNNYTTLTDGWYVLSGNVTYAKCLHIEGNVNLILVDDATLTAEDGIYIMEGKTLTVYGQSRGTGKISAHSDSGPGIGGMKNTKAGHFIIHGGTIDAAAGSSNNAGIGGGNHESGIQSVTIYGGTVTAVGGSSGAGIGKGQQNNLDETITIYGGTVKAIGGDNAAGIGGGEDRGNGTISIYGGQVEATGGSNGAGIGGGDGDIKHPIHIYGGTITARGGGNGFGIGQGGGSGFFYSEIRITGGTVNAYGSGNGAGIGGNAAGGEPSQGIYKGKVIITGGRIYAEGGENGPGIGGEFIVPELYVDISGGEVHAVGGSGQGSAGIGGRNGSAGASVNITGGTVIVEASNSRSLIGRGYNAGSEDPSPGKLTIGNGMMVTAGPSAQEAGKVAALDRVTYCEKEGIHYARIEPCDHSGAASATTCPYCGSGYLSLPDGSVDNAGTISEKAGWQCDVILEDRTLWKDGSWNTLCLPFGLESLTGTPLEGATIKTLTGATFSNGVLTLTFGEAVTAIEAGKPYIVRWNNGLDVFSPAFTAVTIPENTPASSVTCSGVTFTGTYIPVSVFDANHTKLYLGADNKLYYATSALDVNSFRGYFVLGENLQPNAVSSLVMDFGEEPVGELDVVEE